MTQSATTIHPPLATTGTVDNVTIHITPIGRQVHATRLMVTSTVTAQDVTSLDITALTSFLLTENATSTHQHLMIVDHANYLTVSYIPARAIIAITVLGLCFPPVTASATKIRLK